MAEREADRSRKAQNGASARVTPRRPGWFQRMAQYLQEVRQELKRTQWPGRDEWIRATEVVLGLVVAVGLYIFVIDVAVGEVLRLVLGLGR